jgi:drug/metabolite transporter (DMT)-like permease
MAFDPISSLLAVGQSLIERLIPDPKAKAEATQKLLEMQQSGDLAIIAGQNNINLVEAANPRLFVSGWRPFIGWVCGSALAFQLVIAPMLMWGSTLAHHPVQPPIMQTELLTTLLISMLGMGGMRTVEKLQGVASK